MQVLTMTDKLTCPVAQPGSRPISPRLGSPRQVNSRCVSPRPGTPPPMHLSPRRESMTCIPLSPTHGQDIARSSSKLSCTLTTIDSEEDLEELTQVSQDDEGYLVPNQVSVPGEVMPPSDPLSLLPYLTPGQIHPMIILTAATPLGGSTSSLLSGSSDNLLADNMSSSLSLSPCNDYAPPIPERPRSPCILEVSNQRRSPYRAPSRVSIASDYILPEPLPSSSQQTTEQQLDYPIAVRTTASGLLADPAEIPTVTIEIVPYVSTKVRLPTPPHSRSPTPPPPPSPFATKIVEKVKEIITEEAREDLAEIVKEKLKKKGKGKGKKRIATVKMVPYRPPKPRLPTPPSSRSPTPPPPPFATKIVKNIKETYEEEVGEGVAEKVMEKDTKKVSDKGKNKKDTITVEINTYPSPKKRLPTSPPIHAPTPAPPPSPISNKIEENVEEIFEEKAEEEVAEKVKEMVKEKVKSKGKEEKETVTMDWSGVEWIVPKKPRNTKARFICCFRKKKNKNVPCKYVHHDSNDESVNEINRAALIGMSIPSVCECLLICPNLHNLLEDIKEYTLRTYKAGPYSPGREKREAALATTQLKPKQQLELDSIDPQDHCLSVTFRQECDGLHEHYLARFAK